ncbi:hypothetical protein SAMN05421681_107170 [Lysobacter enzymogenes]|nr:hypothetical protein SAMN05421681_107170 [Lysobacter enzymogenes]
MPPCGPARAACLRGVISARYHAAMSKSSALDYADGRVVHLVARLDPPAVARPPEALALPSRLGAAGRTWFAVANTFASVVAAWGIFILWTHATPGWWFDLLFTLMLAGLAAALWALRAASIRQAQFERGLQARWRELAPAAVAATGRIVGRDWVLAEDGSVSSFVLTVQSSEGDTLSALWQPANARQSLLQAQVPGIGAAVRVWRAPGAPADAPLAIEVADPSVVE